MDMNDETLSIILKMHEHIKSLDDEIISLIERVDKLENSAKHQSVTTSSTTNSTYNKYKFDYSQYRFNGRIYCKNRLVLAVVKKYIADNPNTSAIQLMTAFPKNLQGGFGVIRKLDDITQYETYSVRFFTEQNDLIHTTTDVCTVCTQWGIGNIGNFIERARKLGYNIEKV